MNRSSLVLSSILIAVATAASAATPPRDVDRVVAVVDGFEITARAANSDYYLYEAMGKIANGRLALKAAGIDSSPAAVISWRDAKLATTNKRADAFRRYLANPQDARRIYNESGDVSRPYDEWQKEASRFKDEAAIARWQGGASGLGYIFPSERRRSWATWQLLEAMLAERRLPPTALPPGLKAVLDDTDLKILADLSREYGEGEIDIGPYGGYVTQAERGARDSTTTVAGATASSALTTYIAEDLAKINHRERLKKLKLKILDPGYEGVRKYLERNPEYEKSREELLRPMSLEEAAAELRIGDGRASLAYLKLAKAGKDAEPVLLKALDSKNGYSAAGSLVLLRYLRSQNGLAEIEARTLWGRNAVPESVSNQAIATLVAMKPALVADILRESVKKHEADKWDPPGAHSWIPSEIHARMIFFARASPSEAPRVLKHYLKSPRLGIALEAARVLARLGDDAGYGVAKKCLEESRGITDVADALSVFRILNQRRSVAVLDAYAKAHSAPQAAALARQLEFTSLEPRVKWKTALAWAVDSDQNTSRKGFDFIYEAAIGRDPGALAALRELSLRKSSIHQQEALDTLEFIDRLTVKP